MTTKSKLPPGVSRTGLVDGPRLTIDGAILETFVCEATGLPLAASWFSQADDTVEIMYRDGVTKKDHAARIDAKWMPDGPNAGRWEMTLEWHKPRGRKLHKLEFLASGQLLIDETEDTWTD